MGIILKISCVEDQMPMIKVSGKFSGKAGGGGGLYVPEKVRVANVVISLFSN